MRLGIGSDHAGYEYKQALVDFANGQGHTTVSFGATSTDSYDYPDASDAVSEAILANDIDLAVLICGTGIGVSIRANRYVGIRAAVCCGVEAAQLARQHNHANILCLGARTMSLDSAKACLTAFLETGEDHTERHERRVRKLDDATLAGA